MSLCKRGQININFLCTLVLFCTIKKVVKCCSFTNWPLLEEDFDKRKKRLRINFLSLTFSWIEGVPYCHVKRWSSNLKSWSVKDIPQFNTMALLVRNVHILDIDNVPLESINKF